EAAADAGLHRDRLPAAVCGSRVATGGVGSRRKDQEPRARRRRVPVGAERDQHAVHRRQHRQALGKAVSPEPRLAPKPRDEWDDETRALIGDNSLNIFATLAHHPKLMKRWMVFGSHVLAKNTLPARDRELLILRTGWNCGSPYEWG